MCPIGAPSGDLDAHHPTGSLDAVNTRQSDVRARLPWAIGALLLVLALVGALALDSSSDPSQDATAAGTESLGAGAATTTTVSVAVEPEATPSSAADTSSPAPTSSPTATDVEPDAAADATVPAPEPPTTAPNAPSTLPATVANPAPVADATFPATAAAFARLAAPNSAASITVARGGDIVFHDASGPTLGGSAATSDTPMVVASVSKLPVALGIARLHERGLIDVDAPVPWTDLGLDPGEGWADVTVREILDHEGGIPKAQESWFTGQGSCREHLPSLVASPPTADRGTWVYSNGNYCLLGLILEQRTGEPLDVALQELIFDPAAVAGAHLAAAELLPGDAPHWEGTLRLSRLGGAGQLVVSTDDLALVFDRLTPTDREILQPPGVFTDQYGFGHTGTVTGAKACVWILEDGATAVAATIAGNSVDSGGDVCDIVVPAVASDLGLGSAKPERTP